MVLPSVVHCRMSVTSAFSSIVKNVFFPLATCAICRKLCLTCVAGSIVTKSTLTGFGGTGLKTSRYLYSTQPPGTNFVNNVLGKARSGYAANLLRPATNSCVVNKWKVFQYFAVTLPTAAVSVTCERGFRNGVKLNRKYVVQWSPA